MWPTTVADDSSSFTSTTVILCVMWTVEKGGFVARAFHLVHPEGAVDLSKLRLESRCPVNEPQHPRARVSFMMPHKFFGIFAPQHLRKPQMIKSHFNFNLPKWKAVFASVFDQTCTQLKHFVRHDRRHKQEVRRRECSLREDRILQPALLLQKWGC